MLIDREVVLAELDAMRKSCIAHMARFEEGDTLHAAWYHRQIQIDDFRTFIESLPPPADVSALVKEAREVFDGELKHLGGDRSLVGDEYELIGRLADSVEAQEKKLAVAKTALRSMTATNHPQAVASPNWYIDTARKALEDLK